MKIIITSLKLLLLMIILTGVFYPFLIFGIAKLIFPDKSQGSFIEINGRKIGSELIAQKFENPRYFHPRPSAIDFEPLPSGGSNLGPSSKKLKEISDSLKNSYIIRNSLNNNTEIPADAIFSSSSGIDPHISRENAFLQEKRISEERGFNEEKRNELKELINKLTENPLFGILGESRINVLILNLELDKL